MIDIQKIQQAIFLSQNGKIKEAETLYMELDKDFPNEPVLLSAIGLFYVDNKNYDKAVYYLKKACEKKKSFGTVSALGLAEYERQNYNIAAGILEQALELGENADIYNKLISSLFNIQNYKKAIYYTGKMFELYPEDSRTTVNRIKAFTQSGKLVDAEKLCIDALKKEPSFSPLWFQLGFLKELIYSDDTLAKECYKAAAELGNPAADFNIGVSCYKLGEYKEAEKHYLKMLSNFPNDENTKNALGICYLKQKKFEEGYKFLYDRQLETKNITQNLWKIGDKIADEVVIIGDQGLGDQIQFIRYLPFLKGKKITAAVSKPLEKLFKYNYPEIEFVDYKQINPNTQSIRLTDIAFALDMDFDNIPFAEKYLKCEYKNIENSKLKVGLCWEAGAAGIRTMINRTVHVNYFEPLFDIENVQIYSLQYQDTLKGNEKFPQMINLAKDFRDFYDTAAAIMSMDVVVTVDTSVAHLSGALGKKTCLLLPKVSDWRWFDDNETTPWYKSIEIFKQTDNISWEEPINNIIKIIEQYPNRQN